MTPTAYAQHYRTITTQTASQGQLLLQLYQGAMKQIGQARVAIESNDPAAAHHHIMRAQDIVQELHHTLDHKQSPELAGRLAALYSYFRQRLIAANIQKDVQPLDEILGMLRQLHGAWQTAVRQTTRQAS